MFHLLAFTLAAALQVPSTDPAARTTTEAFVSAIGRVCPIYMKIDGMTAADEAVLNAEMALRAGMVGYLKQGGSGPGIVIQAGPGSCLVMPMPNGASTTSTTDHDAQRVAILDWLQSPASGWTPSPTDGEPGRYVSTDGLQTLIVVDEPDESSLMVLIQAVTPTLQNDLESRVEARRQADMRPTDEAMLDAVKTLCGLALTPAWSTIQSGEIVIRHAGESVLSVDYVQNGDCTVRATGQDAAAVSTALRARLEASGSGWTRANHAWMLVSVDPSDLGIEANYRHDAGHELVVLLDVGEAQAILWQPKRAPRP